MNIRICIIHLRKQTIIIYYWNISINSTRGDFATLWEFKSLEDVNGYIIDELRERANAEDLNKFLDYEVVQDQSETLSQEDFAGLDDYEISR